MKYVYGIAQIDHKKKRSAHYIPIGTCKCLPGAATSYWISTEHRQCEEWRLSMIGTVSVQLTSSQLTATPCWPFCQLIISSLWLAALALQEGFVLDLKKLPTHLSLGADKSAWSSLFGSFHRAEWRYAFAIGTTEGSLLFRWRSNPIP